MSFNRPVLVTLTALATALSAVPTADAARSRFYRGLHGPTSSLEASEIARDFVHENRARLGIERIELSPMERVVKWRGHAIVRIGQEYDGLPVFDRVIVVRVDRAGQVRTVVTNATPKLDLVTAPAVTAEEALRTAASPWGLPKLGMAALELGVKDDGGRGRLVWKVEGTPHIRRWRVYVDAVTGELLLRQSLASDAQGRVFLENPTTTPGMQLVDLPNITAAETHLADGDITVYRYVDGSLNTSLNDLTLEQLAVKDATGNFDYQPAMDASPVFDDPFAEVSVYYNLDRINTYVRDTIGWVPNANHVGIANYGEGADTAYDNAFFTPVGISQYGVFIGQGNNVDLAYDSDVIVHEFGHSIVHDLTNMSYGLGGMAAFDEWGSNIGPPSIHEGMADYWACTTNGNPLVGEYAFPGMGSSARNHDNTLTCPTSLYGEGHQDGMVWGGAAWAIRTAVGDKVLADSLLFGALATLSSEATFRDYAVAVEDTSQAMLGDGDLSQTQVDDVVDVLTTRGMLTCGRAVEMERGDPVQISSIFTYGYIEQMFGFISCDQLRASGNPALPALFQFKIHVPANVSELSFRIQFNPATDLLWRTYIRRGEMVHSNMVSVYGQVEIPDPADYDIEYGPFTSGDFSVPVTGADLVGDSDYYIAVTNMNCSFGTLTVTADYETGAGPGPDAGTETDASTPGADGGTDVNPSDDGCSCAQRGPGAPALPTLLLLLVAGYLVRRRR